MRQQIINQTHSRLTAAFVALTLIALACERRPGPRASDSARAQASVPAYLQPIFHSLDSLLPARQRDSLRALPLDSAFRFRSHRLADEVNPLVGTWMHSAIVDSIVAHGEQPYMTPEIVLDLYQQHLRGETLDLAGALHRVSPEYVDAIRPHIVSVDSVLLEKDLDGDKLPDRLVRERRRDAPEVDDGNGDSAASADTIGYSEYRLALYLGGTPAAARTPVWNTSFDGAADGEFIRAIDRTGGETLLVVGVSGADAYETMIVLVRHGAARTILNHQIDYGEGDFDVRDKDGRVVVVATSNVQLGSHEVSPTIECSREQWPATTLVYDDTAKEFVVERSVCLARK
jgi:hypothetical protein